MIKEIYLSAKHEDRFSIRFTLEGSVIDHNGYAPSINGLCSGDYTRLKIDNATGTIIGWKPITTAELEEILDNEC